MNTLFTIAIPAYKRKYLKEAIDSCLSQTYNNWELVIVDDASPEDLNSIICQYDDPRIKSYRNEKNIGAADVVDNWNVCLTYAKGDYIICMGDDDRLLPNCLEEYRKLIEKYPNVNVLHALTEIIDENSEFIRYQYSRPEWESVYELIYNRWQYRFDQFIGDFCFKISALRNNGGFYKLPLAWGSDDLSAYIAAKPFGIANTQVPGFQYRKNSINISSVGSVELKVKAIYKEKEWYISFFRTVPSRLIDVRLRNELLYLLDKYIYWKIEILLSEDIKSSVFSGLRNLIKLYINHLISFRLFYRTIGRSIIDLFRK